MFRSCKILCFLVVDFVVFFLGFIVDPNLTYRKPTVGVILSLRGNGNDGTGEFAIIIMIVERIEEGFKGLDFIGKHLISPVLSTNTTIIS